MTWIGVFSLCTFETSLLSLGFIAPNEAHIKIHAASYKFPLALAKLRSLESISKSLIGGGVHSYLFIDCKLSIKSFSKRNDGWPCIFFFRGSTGTHIYSDESGSLGHYTIHVCWRGAKIISKRACAYSKHVKWLHVEQFFLFDHDNYSIATNKYALQLESFQHSWMVAKLLF